MGTASENLVNDRAYELWQVAGKPIGRDTEFWLTAESELTSPMHDEPSEAAKQEEAGILVA